MARNRISIQGDLFKDYMTKLDKLGGNSAMRKGTEEALKASKEYVNPQIEKAMAKGNLPHHGKYSKGGTLSSLDKDTNVSWSGLIGETKVGFDMSKSGLKSIFLIYGTPKMSPVKGLKNAIYGNATQKKIADIQGEALTKVVKEIMEG